MMRSVVTGGAGFIGSHLVEALLKKGHVVTVLDNLSTGRLENINFLQNKPNLHFHHVDIRQREKLQTYFKDVDWVFHLAALADIVPSIQRPLEYFGANVDGTVNVLEAARSARVKRFVYAASSSCYGIPDTYPTPETAEVRPRYPYALTKFLGEQCVLHWGSVYGLPVVALRFFNVYGPRSRTSGTYGAVFGVFMSQKLHNKPFTVVGDGKQTRDFTFVTDAVEALTAAASSSVVNEVMNVGSGHTYSVNQLVVLLEGDVVYIPKRPGEPDCTFADISKITRLLDWKPYVSLKDGVKILLENISYWNEAPVWTPQKIEVATKDWYTYLSK